MGLACMEEKVGQENKVIVSNVVQDSSSSSASYVYAREHKAQTKTNITHVFLLYAQEKPEAVIKESTDSSIDWDHDLKASVQAEHATEKTTFAQETHFEGFAGATIEGFEGVVEPR